MLRDSLTTWNELFLCCIVGEFNAGKSSLINALLGGVHCEEGVLPTTAAVRLLKHPSVWLEPPASASASASGLQASSPIV